MKKRIIKLAVAIVLGGILLAPVNLYAGNGKNIVKGVVGIISTIIGDGSSEIPCWSAGNTNTENGGVYVLCSTCEIMPGDFKGPQGTCKSK